MKEVFALFHWIIDNHPDLYDDFLEECCQEEVQ